jgi:hypothetical protein
MSPSGSEKSRVNAYVSKPVGATKRALEITGALELGLVRIVNVSAFDLPNGVTTVTWRDPAAALACTSTNAVTEVAVALKPETAIPAGGLNSIAVAFAKPVPVIVNDPNVWFARELAGFKAVIAGTDPPLPVEPTENDSSFEPGPLLRVTQTFRSDGVAVAAI